MANQEQFFDVVIIGGGLAGLAAASILKEQGLKACIFEARNRVGGRIWSLQNNIWNMIVEMGGEFVGYHHTTVRKWCDKFNLKLRPNNGNDFAEILPDKIIIDGTVINHSRIRQLKRELEKIIDEIIELTRLC